MEVLRLDAAPFVEQRVDECEADRVRFGAGADRAGEAVGGLGQPWVDPPPQLARGVIELEPPGLLGVPEDASEVAGET